MYYAWFKGKKLSLGTRDHEVAMRRYPAAMQRLRDRVNAPAEVWVPPAPDEVAVMGEQQPDGSFIEKEVSVAEIYEPEELELTWEQAFQIHNRRLKERRGKEVSASTLESQRIARAPLTTGPTRMAVGDVQRYVDGLREQGLSPATVGQRHGMCRAVTKTLIKQGYLSQNVWDRVDCSYATENHIPTATPEEVRVLWATGDWHIRVLLFTGLAEMELLQSRQEDVDGDWLHIVEYQGRRLKNRYRQRDVLLPSWAGRELPKAPKQGTLLARIKRVCPRLSVHSTRHTFRTACRSAGINTELAEKMLGHASEGQIQTYGEFRSEDLKPAFEEAWKVMDKWLA